MWNFDSPLFHPEVRDDTTLPYGHNKRLHGWFWVSKNNAKTHYATKGKYGLTYSYIIYKVLTEKI